jgi:hypothetical protein
MLCNRHVFHTLDYFRFFVKRYDICESGMIACQFLLAIILPLRGLALRRVTAVYRTSDILEIHERIEKLERGP